MAGLDAQKADTLAERGKDAGIPLKKQSLNNAKYSFKPIR